MAPKRCEFLMQPLHVTVTLAESIVMREPPMLDGILAAVVAMRQGLVPLGDPLEWPELPIPLEKSGCGRYWLCSSGFAQTEAYDSHHKHRRAPVTEYARLGARCIKRADTAAGADKSHRVPYVRQILLDDTIEWWAQGDLEGVRDLLSDAHYLGKFRGSGKGRVRSWTVEQCEPWGKGFPVLRERLPTRPLPLDTPGLWAQGCKRAHRSLRPPYWLHEREELVAVPC